MNGGEDGWESLPDRVEIAWGPDHRNRYDLYLFQGDRRGDYFAEIPREFDLPIKDKRADVATFDLGAESKRIGISSTHADDDQVVRAGGY